MIVDKNKTLLPKVSAWFIMIEISSMQKISVILQICIRVLIVLYIFNMEIMKFTN